MSTTFTATLAQPLWTIKRAAPTDKMRDVERQFCITVESALDGMKTDPNVMTIVRMVKRANKIFNSRVKDKRNRFDVEIDVYVNPDGLPTIVATLNTTFSSKELFQIINSK